MQHYPIYRPQSHEIIKQFINQQPSCTLVTKNAEQVMSSGFFNPIFLDDQLYLHLHSEDKQLTDLRLHPDAMILFQNYHGFIPSYAKDPQDASYATMFYRHVELQVMANVINDDLKVAQILDVMMKKYQPEGGYLSLVENLAFYEQSLAMIRVIHFEVKKINAKWKLGQNRSPQEQLLAHSYIR